MELYDQDRTIAAIATAPGTGGIGIVRISGPKAVEIADAVFRKPSGKKLASARTHTIHYGHVVDPASDAMIDQVLVMLMRAPHTYTGADTVEIQCHGGPFVEQKILETVVSAGAAPADRGEFSKQAFLNGKMDLSQAEAVMDLIAATSEMSRRASIEQLAGRLAQEIENQCSLLLDLTTLIEANIDYPEYDIEEVTYERLIREVSKVLESLRELYRTSDSGIRMHQGVKTVILGRPNVGKSSLMNRILGKERAIVTDIAGTTRDVIEENVDLDGVPLRLIDTAGLRQTSDAVEKIGVDLARKAAEGADLVLWILDASVPEDLASSAEAAEMLDFLKEKQYIILINKNDLTDARVRPAAIPAEAPLLWISARTGDGMQELSAKIREMFFRGAIQADSQPMITNVRQKDVLRRALEALESALEAAKNDLPEDVIMIDLTNAYDALGEISGKTLKSDVIDEIFKRFCLGK